MSLKGRITIRIVEHIVSYFQTFGFYSNYEEKVELYFLLIKIIFKNLYQKSFSKYPALVPDRWLSGKSCCGFKA
jgi:hypothetical protein